MKITLNNVPKNNERKIFSFYREDNVTSIMLYPVEEFTLKPHETITIKSNASLEFANNTESVITCPKLRNQGVICITVTDKPTEKTTNNVVSVYIVNTSNKPVEINTDTALGEIDLYSAADDYSCIDVFYNQI